MTTEKAPKELVIFYVTSLQVLVEPMQYFKPNLQNVNFECCMARLLQILDILEIIIHIQ